MFSFITDVLEDVTEVVDDEVFGGLGVTRAVASPVIATSDIADGLTEGEIRTDSVAELAIDAAGAKVISELTG